MQNDPAIWLLSDGRSGSTWFARLLASVGGTHVEHEPIHPYYTPALDGQALLPLPSDSAGGLLQPLFEAIRSGAYRTARFGEQDRHEGGSLVIRDVFALFAAPRLLAACPWLRPVLLVRHPAEVAASKCALADWDWFEAVESFAQDEALIAAFPDLMRHIARADTPFRRHVLTWCLGHAWLLRHVPDLPVVAYPLGREAGLEAVTRIMGRAPSPAAYAAAFQARSPTDRPPDGRNALLKLIKPRHGPTRAERAWGDRMMAAFGLDSLLAAQLNRLPAR